jgi:predicted nucleic-acid-binding protein
MIDTRIVDANVILRYLLADHPVLSPRAKELFDGVRAGERGAYIPQCVLVECVYVMQRIYQVGRAEIAEKLSALLGFRGITGEQIPLLREALGLYAQTTVSFVDALIAATAAARHLGVETYDQDLQRLLDR